MRLRQLVYFVNVTECRSFSKASKLLHISQPTLSQSIQALESELGFKLLKRGTGGVFPTKMGEIVFNDSKSILEDADKKKLGWEELDKKRKSVTGTVRLLAYPSAYCFASLRIIDEYGEFYPNLKWKLMESRGSNIPTILNNSQADLCVGDYPSEEEDAFFKFAKENGLRVIPLKKDKCLVAVSCKNPLSKKDDLSKEEAATLSLACYSGGDDVAEPFLEKFFDSRLTVELHSFEKIVDYAIDDIAVSPIAESLALNGILSMRDPDSVKFLTVAGFSLPVTHCLIYSSRLEIAPHIACAKKIIEEAYSKL